MEFFYNKIIKNTDQKITDVQLETNLTKTKKCCDINEAAVLQNILQIKFFIKNSKKPLDKYLALSILSTQNNVNTFVQINNCPFCGEKIKFTLVETIQYDERNPQSLENRRLYCNSYAQLETLRKILGILGGKIDNEVTSDTTSSNKTQNSGC